MISLSYALEVVAAVETVLPLVLPALAQVPDVILLNLGPDDAPSLKGYWGWQCESDDLLSTCGGLQPAARPALEG